MPEQFPKPLQPLQMKSKPSSSDDFDRDVVRQQLDAKLAIVVTEIKLAMGELKEAQQARERYANALSSRVTAGQSEAALLRSQIDERYSLSDAVNTGLEPAAREAETSKEADRVRNQEFDEKIAAARKILEEAELKEAELISLQDSLNLPVQSLDEIAEKTIKKIAQVYSGDFNAEVSLYAKLREAYALQLINFEVRVVPSNNKHGLGIEGAVPVQLRISLNRPNSSTSHWGVLMSGFAPQSEESNSMLLSDEVIDDSVKFFADMPYNKQNIFKILDAISEGKEEMEKSAA